MRTATSAADLELDGEVLLGDDYDCQTCGWSNNAAAWYVEDDEITVQLTFGCTGGDFIVTTDLDQAVEYLLEVANTFPDAKPALAAEAERMRTLVGAARP